VAALVSASATCREWRTTASYVLGHIFRADLSALGPRASAAALQACKQRVGAAVGGVRCVPEPPLPAHAPPAAGVQAARGCGRRRRAVRA
jgi:hypothetical protein